MRLAALLFVFGIASCSQDDLQAPHVIVPDQERVLEISHGESIEIEEHLPDEGWTLVEFGATW